MRRTVKRKQPNSKMCLVCGLKNPFGLRSAFFELDNGELLAVFTPLDEHQSYPGRLHGGMAAAILDEAIGRAIMAHYAEAIWGVTIEFTCKYRKPLPLNQELRVLCRISQDSGRFFAGSGEILLKDGSVAVEGKGKYLKIALEKIANFDAVEQEWHVSTNATDPEFFDL